MPMTSPIRPAGILGLALLLASCGSSGGGKAAAPIAPVAPPAAIAVDTALRISDTVYQPATVFAVKQGGSGSGTMRVRLASAPTAPVTLTVARTAGDPDQVIYNLATHVTGDSYALAFDATTWNQWQAVYFVTIADTDGHAESATFSVTGGTADHIAATQVVSFPALAATTTITGTITRQGFTPRAVDFTDPQSDVAYTLSWIKHGTGTAARYYGTWTDNDPLNQPPGGSTGNETRAALTYPAYGFWSGGQLLFVTVKNILTQRGTSEANLILLRAADEAFASGTGYVTATGAAIATIGSYPVAFTGTAATAAQLTGLFEVPGAADYPITTTNLQSQTYSPGTVGAVNGQWSLTRTAGDDFLVDGTTVDSHGAAAGTLHGIVTGSFTGLGVPNLLGALDSGGSLYLFGLPFYSAPDATFPFGALGGRFINAADGTSDRLFLFLSFPSG